MNPMIYVWVCVMSFFIGMAVSSALPLLNP